MKQSVTSENVPLLTTNQDNYRTTQPRTLSSTKLQLEQESEIQNEHNSNQTQDQDEDTSCPNEKTATWPGYVFCILSGLCFLGCNVCIKFASSGSPVSSWQMLFVRCFVQKISMVPILVWTKAQIMGPPDVKTRMRMCAQALLSGGILLCYFEGIRRLPLGDFGAIAFSSPAFCMVLSIFILKEHCGIYRVLIGSILTVGVVIISRPPALFPVEGSSTCPTSQEDNGTSANTTVNMGMEKKVSVDILGIVFSLLGSALSAWVTIIARQVSHIHFSVQVFWFSLGGEIISLLGMFLIDSSPLFTTWTMATWLLAAGQGVLGLVGTVLILKALQWISPTKNKVVRSFQVVVSYIIQVAAFGSIPHLTDCAGAGLIVAAVLGIALEDYFMKTMQDRQCRYF